MSDDTHLNELALANMEALAQSKTSEVFTNATCCIAFWDNHSCSGCDGNLKKFVLTGIDSITNISNAESQQKQIQIYLNLSF